MIRTEHIDILPTFGSLSAVRCDKLFGFPEPIEVGRDVYLSHHGIPPSKVYWIESGIVKKMSLQQDGTELITGLRTTGWIVGAAAALASPRQESIEITATK
jgi:CRP-like cAMP-binding protein